MKTRAEVAKYIEDQLGSSYAKPPIPDRLPGKGPWAWHYGKCELRDLMDFIYGEPPIKEEDYIK